MEKQVAHRLSILSGAVAAPLIDGLYFLCEDTAPLMDLYTILTALYNDGRCAEGCHLLTVLLKFNLLKIPDFMSHLKTNEDAEIFLQEFLEDFSEILCEYQIG